MKRIHGWFIVLLLAALLLSACGPEMVTPTPAEEAGGVDTAAPASAPTENAPQPTATQPSAPSAGELPVDSEDWHVLGSPDALVTIIEYSDFQ